MSKHTFHWSHEEEKKKEGSEIVRIKCKRESKNNTYILHIACCYKHREVLHKYFIPTHYLILSFLSFTCCKYMSFFSLSSWTLCFDYINEFYKSAYCINRKTAGDVNFDVIIREFLNLVFIFPIWGCLAIFFSNYYSNTYYMKCMYKFEDSEYFVWGKQ